jgi:glycosyltransferase involved in cell wall biosynthesis
VQITAIIPTYNCGPLAVEAVASVLVQTRPVDEIIVVDDGSTDDTAERMATFGNRIRYFRKQNGGVSSARNLGVNEARCEWIAFLDADDVWHPRKLQFQCEALMRRPELSLLGNTLYDWPGEHPAYAEGIEGVVESIRLEDLIVQNRLVTSTILARTEALRTAGPFDLELRGPEDHDMWIRVAQGANVANLKLALTGYRSSTPGSLSKNTERMEAGMQAILEKLQRGGAFRGKPFLCRKAWGHFRYSCGFMHFRTGNMWSACDRLLRSLCSYPLPYGKADIRVFCGRVRLLAKSAVLGLIRR